MSCFYLDASNTLTSVLVSASGPTFSAGKPATVFEHEVCRVKSLPPLRRIGGRPAVPDDQRQRSRQCDRDSSASMVVVLNWFQG